MLSPEFSAKRAGNARRPVGRLTERILRKVWALRLARSGFRDLENPENPDGLLSAAGGPSNVCHLRGWSAPRLRREQRTEASYAIVWRGDVTRLTSLRADMEETAEFYRRMEHLAARFENETDRAIAGALADGHVQQRIKADLHVGQGRIERVERQLRIWMAEPRQEEDSE